MKKHHLFLSLTAVYDGLASNTVSEEDVMDGMFALQHRRIDHALAEFNRNKSSAMLSASTDELLAERIHTIAKRAIDHGLNTGRAVRTSAMYRELDMLLTRHEFPAIMNAVEEHLLSIGSHAEREASIAHVIAKRQLPLTVHIRNSRMRQNTGLHSFAGLQNL